ncbi:MAG: sulfite exporter TauE/SafE family protein [Candidatus Roizmanbacteria bacterium]
MKNQQQTTLYVKGMHCPSCDVFIKDTLNECKNIINTRANYKSNEVTITHKGSLDINELNKSINEFGYTILDKKPISKEPLSKILFDTGAIAGILFIIYFFIQELHLIPSFEASVSLSLGAIFALGLVASTSTCMATSGALYLATIGKLHDKNSQQSTHIHSLSFVLGRLISYSFFGFVLGMLGKGLTMNLGITIITNIIIGIAMIFVALDMLKIISFNTFIPQNYSKGLFVRLKSQLLRSPKKSAFLLGAITYLLPCGFTQSIQLYAIGLANPLQSALTMFIFALGTIPALVSIGYIHTFAKSSWFPIISKVIAVFILIVGFYHLQIVYTTSGIADKFISSPEQLAQTTTATIEGGKQILRMNVNSSGYEPNQFTIKNGVPVKWIITGENVFGCQASFSVPQMGIQKIIQKGENIIEFTPKDRGVISFSCTMGMYNGSIHVI